MASQNQLSRYGALSRVIPELSPAGRVFLVIDSDDTTVGPDNLGNDFPVDNKGVVRVYSIIQDAVNACDSRGDVVLVAPYYTQDFERADCWAAAGVQVIGMGSGDARPALRFDTAGATINIRADGIRVSNLMFMAGEDSIARAINLDTGFFGQRLDHCLFNKDSAADNFRVMVRVGAKESVIEDNHFIARDTGVASGRAISIVGGDPDQLVIRNNYIYGQYDTVSDTTDGAASIGVDTTNLADTNLSGVLIEKNLIVNTDTAVPSLLRLGAGGLTVRGLANENRFVTYDSATADTSKILGGGIRFTHNYIGMDSTEKLIGDSFVAAA